MLCEDMRGVMKFYIEEHSIITDKVDELMKVVDRNASCAYNRGSIALLQQARNTIEEKLVNLHSNFSVITEVAAVPYDSFLPSNSTSWVPSDQTSLQSEFEESLPTATPLGLCSQPHSATPLPVHLVQTTYTTQPAPVMTQSTALNYSTSLQTVTTSVPQQMISTSIVNSEITRPPPQAPTSLSVKGQFPSTDLVTSNWRENLYESSSDGMALLIKYN